jgi:enamine deaminase RidA (YjgF/YER057c/UK114 family)
VSEGRRHFTSGSPFEPRIGFARAVRVGERVCVSGTGPIWDDGSFDDDPAAQARRCLETIVAALGGLGASAADVVRTRIYLTDPTYIDSVGPVHAEFFGATRPAATAIVVTAFLDPRWKVEIEAEAICAEQALAPMPPGKQDAPPLPP